jgi:hypothetical protein
MGERTPGLFNWVLDQQGERSERSGIDLSEPIFWNDVVAIAAQAPAISDLAQPFFTLLAEDESRGVKVRPVDVYGWENPRQNILDLAVYVVYPHQAPKQMRLLEAKSLISPGAHWIVRGLRVNRAPPRLQPALPNAQTTDR